MLKVKRLCNVVDKTKSNLITNVQTKMKNKNNTIILKIIKQGVNFNLYINITRKHNLYQS